MKNEKTILKSKSILLGVTGGIAAYKSIELTRRLKEEGASVTVVMTDAAKYFITPLTFEVVSGNTVYFDLFSVPMAHITLPVKADIMLIAPATANIIAKFAYGIADDLLSTCFLSFRGKTILAPSMNWRMFENPVLQENLSLLASRGVLQIGPSQGALACGEEGKGRMSEVSEIIDMLHDVLSAKDLSGERILVTAGATREHIDPVRFLSNRSSGKMGYALAKASRERGADVTLISGFSSLHTPPGIRFISAETADDMLKAVQKEIRAATVFIMCAAVSDYAPKNTCTEKIGKKKELLLRLQQTPDIISTAGRGKKRPFIIGFAAETGFKVQRAKKKLVEKNMDMIVLNDVTEAGAGFDTDTNRITIIDKQQEISFPLMTKYATAHEILNRMVILKT